MSAQAMSQAKQVKHQYAFDLLKKRNVIGVGLGYKVSGGENTGELSVVVSVTKKLAATALAVRDIVPQALDGVKTDVVEVGKFRAFELGPADRWRPVAPPGVSVGHEDVTAGTFGCLVRRQGQPFILSNNHVLANLNKGEPNDPILQPGTLDGGVSDDQIAELADYVPIDFGTESADCSFAEISARLLNYIAAALGSRHQLEPVKLTAGVNEVDAALARPLSPDVVNNEILHIGPPTGVGLATLGTEVQKSGRTTGYTQGQITQIDATVRVDYDGPSALFSGQLVASPMSQRGDSGSAVLNMENEVVGLLFAGSDAVTLINPIDAVLSALDVELAV